MLPNEENPHPIGRHGKPAWPILAAIQLGLFLILIVMVLVTPRPPSYSLSQRLRAVDQAGTLAQLENELRDARRGVALEPDEEDETTDYLQQLALSSQMSLESITMRPTAPRQGLLPVDAHIIVHGDPYDLPIFLDGLSQQKATNHPLSIRGAGARDGQFSIILRYYRPEEFDTKWISERLAEEAPEAVDRASILEQAAQLQRWRYFETKKPTLDRRAASARGQISTSLPAQLIEMRTSGGEVFWQLQE